MRSYRPGDYLSADRRCFLYWYWNPLFTIWILQSGQQTGHVRCFDGDISRKQSRISVSVITHSGDRSDRNLGFDIDWLVLSRPDRNPIL